MSLISYNPFGRNVFDDMQRDIDSLWAVLPVAQQEQRLSNWSPRVDVKESDDTITVHADCPGVKAEDLKVELNQGLLTISGQRKSEKTSKDEKQTVVERSFGSFSRSMRVPDGCTENDVKADLADGVLNVTVQKPKRAASAKRIKIGVSNNGK